MADWDRLVREHGPTVFGIAWRVLGHVADTEDVVQEVFLEAHRIRQTQGVRNWGGLLRRLATCRALDRLRQRRNTVSLNGVHLPTCTNGPVEIAIERELADRLCQAIAELPPREGAVFSLRYLENLSDKQIAETLEISVGAVAVALHKARVKLADQLVDAPKEKEYVAPHTAAGRSSDYR